MHDRSEDDLTATEREQFEALPREVMPGRLLEERVVSELRAGKLAPDAALDPQELYFIRVRADVSLNGVNSWIARFSGEAAESDWVQSPLLTPTRRQ